MVHVAIEFHTYEVRAPDPDDSWDAGDYDGAVDRLRVIYDTDDYYFRSYAGFDTELEPPFFVVYCGYRTGSTFGSTFEAAVVGVEKTIEAAEALKEEAEKFEGFGSLSNGFYVPWNGYFESLQFLSIERLA